MEVVCSLEEIGVGSGTEIGIYKKAMSAPRLAVIKRSAESAQATATTPEPVPSGTSFMSFECVSETHPEGEALSGAPLTRQMTKEMVEFDQHMRTLAGEMLSSRHKTAKMSASWTMTSIKSSGRIEFSLSIRNTGVVALMWHLLAKDGSTGLELAISSSDGEWQRIPINAADMVSASMTNPSGVGHELPKKGMKRAMKLDPGQSLSINVLVGRQVYVSKGMYGSVLWYRVDNGESDEEFRVSGMVAVPMDDLVVG